MEWLKNCVKAINFSDNNGIVLDKIEKYWSGEDAKKGQLTGQCTLAKIDWATLEHFLNGKWWWWSWRLFSLKLKQIWDDIETGTKTGKIIWIVKLRNNWDRLKQKWQKIEKMSSQTDTE